MTTQETPRGTLGILALDTVFPRPVGDVGNPASYPFAVQIAVVDGSDSPKIVQDGVPATPLLGKFIDAAQGLEAAGVDAIVSTCGFLITSQAQIAAAVRVPVMLSALSMVPMIRTLCPGRIGILTASQPALGPRSLAAAGLAADEVAIAGLQDVPAFGDAILVTRAQQPNTLDSAAIAAAAAAKAAALQRAHPDLSAIVLECGNLPPYAAEIRAATGLPVFHLLDGAALLMAAQAGRR